jgi:aminopeptidase C
VVPNEEEAVDLTGSDMARWLGLSATDKREELTKKPLPEKTITQEMRQAAYDSWENTDDHGMQIFGTAKDQNGKRYYMVKNSWGTQKSEYKGIWYVSEAYMQYKTNDVLVHKDAIPTAIRKKLGI